MKLYQFYKYSPRAISIIIGTLLFLLIYQIFSLLREEIKWGWDIFRIITILAVLSYFLIWKYFPKSRIIEKTQAFFQKKVVVIILIFWLVIGVFIAPAIYFFFKYQQLTEKTSPVIEYIQKAETIIQEIEKYSPKAGVEEKYTGWESYRNEAYKFELQHPKEWRGAETEPTRSIYLFSIIWGYTHETPEEGTIGIFPMVIDIILKGDKSFEDWISGKSTIYSDYKKLKDITVGGVNTQILVKNIETDKGGKIFVPKNNYVYIIGVSDYISTETRDEVLSTLQFLE